MQIKKTPFQVSLYKPKEIRLAKKSLLSGTEYGRLSASRNFLMEILRISFLYGLRLAKTILCLRASPGLRFSHLYPFPILTGVVIWPGSYQDCQIKKTPFQVSLLFGSFLSSQVHHRPGCLSYGKSKGFPFYNDLQPAETILCFRAKYLGVCA